MLSRQKEGVLTGGGGGTRKTQTESADSASFEDSALRDTCIRVESCKPPLDDGVE